MNISGKCEQIFKIKPMFKIQSFFEQQEKKLKFWLILESEHFSEFFKVFGIPKIFSNHEQFLENSNTLTTQTIFYVL